MTGFGKVVYAAEEGLMHGTLTVREGKIFLSNLSPLASEEDYRGRTLVVPAFADVHVHLREPGFFYKETIASGTESAARGGFTAVCSMSNLDPVPDSVKNLEKQVDIIKKTAKVPVYPFAALTVGEKGQRLSDIEGLAPFVVGFSDDGKGVQSEELMREAMRRVKAVGGIISAHCEDEAEPCMTGSMPAATGSSGYLRRASGAWWSGTSRSPRRRGCAIMCAMSPPARAWS